MVTLYHAFWTGASWLYMILQIHLVHVLYSHCLQGYQDSSGVVCKCFFNFTLCLVFYSHWLPGIMILCKLSMWFFNITFYVCFYSHWLQGYHNSPRIVSMWFFKFSLSVVMYSQWLQGYHDSLWVVLYDSSISLYVWFCIHIGYLYHDSLWVVSMWFFNFALCFCIHIDYRGILLLREMSQCDSLNSLCVWFSHWLQGYRDSSWVVSKWFFNFALCDLVFSL